MLPRLVACDLLPDGSDVARVPGEGMHVFLVRASLSLSEALEIVNEALTDWCSAEWVYVGDCLPIVGEVQGGPASCWRHDDPCASVDATVAALEQLGSLRSEADYWRALGIVLAVAPAPVADALRRVQGRLRVERGDEVA